MENAFLSYLSQQAFNNNVPFSGQFELTPVCNLNCKMCYIHKSEEDSYAQKRLLPASFWVDLARQIKEAGTLVLSLTGGETLLYPEIDELMGELSKMGFLISFNTNGTLIDEKRVAWFRHYAPTKINITLYGASNKTYEKLCGITDGFDRVSYAISHLQEAGLNVYLNGVITPEHVDELNEMHKFAKSFGLELHTASYIFPKLDANGCPYKIPQAHRLTGKEAAEISCMDIIERKGIEEFKRQAVGLRQNFNITEALLKKSPSMKVCRGGKCMYAVSWQGKLRPCSLLTAIEIPLNEENRDFMTAWKELQREVSNLSVPDKCTTCKKQNICPVCKAALYRETGEFTKAPEYLCEYSNRMEEIVNSQEFQEDGQTLGTGELFNYGCLD